MSCEYGQTSCEDKNMEADRNKRGLGERREAERQREMQRERWGSWSGEEIVLAWWPEAFQLSGHHYLSFLPLRSRVLVLRCQGSVWYTHTHSQTPLWSHRLHSLAVMFISSCVHQCLCARVFSWHAFMYLAVCLCVCVYRHCLLCYLRSVLRSRDPEHHFNWWDF